MDLHLIRHAQSQNNAGPTEQRVADPSLTELGHQQAQQLAEYVKSLRLTRLISSPFLRTLQTTQHVHAGTQLPVTVRTQLHEQGGCYSGYAAVGRVGEPGMTRQAIEAEFKPYDVGPEIDGEGWWRSQPYEDEDRATERARALLADTRQEFGHTSERVAYIMHGDIKMLLVGLISGEPVAVPHNASVTTLRVTSEVVELVEYNHVGFLPSELLTS